MIYEQLYFVHNCTINPCCGVTYEPFVNVSSNHDVWMIYKWPIVKSTINPCCMDDLRDAIHECLFLNHEVCLIYGRSFWNILSIYVVWMTDEFPFVNVSLNHDVWMIYDQSFVDISWNHNSWMIYEQLFIKVSSNHDMCMNYD